MKLRVESDYCTCAVSGNTLVPRPVQRTNANETDLEFAKNMCWERSASGSSHTFKCIANVTSLQTSEWQIKCRTGNKPLTFEMNWAVAVKHLGTNTKQTVESLRVRVNFSKKLVLQVNSKK